VLVFPQRARSSVG